MSEREVPEAEPVSVYERDISYECYRVYWRDPKGFYRRSHECQTLSEAQVRSGRHPWPFAIVREYHVEEVEVVSRG